MAARSNPIILELRRSFNSAIDNLNRADRLGLVERPDEWIALRQLRNRLVHEYMDDAEEFASVLNVVLGLSGELIEAVGRIRLFAEGRFENVALGGAHATDA